MKANRRRGTPEGRTSEVTRTERSLAGAISTVAGGAMHAVVGAFVLATGRVAPWWVAGLTALVWLAGAVTLWRWRNARPLAALFVPFAVAGVWLAAVSASAR